MRALVVLAALTLAACAAPTAGPATTTTLTSANAATALLAGSGLRMSVTTQAASAGMDPLVTLTLSQADGRSLRFQQANHTAEDLMTQRPGGPLAQVMGFFGEETPTYYRRVEGGNGAPFICGADGPVALGVHESANGEVAIVALKQNFTYETLADGTQSALPMSPEQVCARMAFRRS
jgi:hypothetical protein